MFEIEFAFLVVEAEVELVVEVGLVGQVQAEVDWECRPDCRIYCKIESNQKESTAGPYKRFGTETW